MPAAGGSSELRRETRYAPTGDGWELALHRYRPQREPGAAVILCPGYACNRFFVDFDERTSLARFLARAGFDAWVVELRGRGESRATALCLDPDEWTFDDLAHFDVPAALECVRREIGHGRIAWVGHSMGGMAVYAYLGHAPEGAPRPAAAVTMAAPVVFPRMAWRALHSIGSTLLALPFPARLPQRPALGLLWHLVSWTGHVEIGMNPDNVDRHVVGAALRRSLTNVSRTKLRQLADWSETGRFGSLDGRLDYREGLERIEVPTLVLAGAFDRLAPPESVRLAYDRLGARRRRFVVAGRAEGFATDYGHVDLVLGIHAPEEIFPLVAGWVREQLAAAEDGGTTVAQEGET